MTLQWPWGLIALPVVLAAAVWALRRRMQRIARVSSLGLWREALAALPASATRSARRVTAAWVVLLASAHKGDANLNAHVDVLDLAILANHFGMGGAKWGDANFNGDDKVDVLDLAILANNFGWDGGGAAPVPEPATALLVVLCGLPMLRRRKRFERK